MELSQIKEPEMEVIPEPTIDTSLPVVPHTRAITMARWVSNIFCPPILAIAGVCLVSSYLASVAAWLWGGFIILSSILTPVGYILFQLRSGKVSDFEIYHREQRKGTYVFTMLCGVISVIVMWLFAAPVLIIILGLSAVLQVILMALINTRWKISAHSASMAVFITLLVFLFGRSMLPTTIGIPLMVWSRVRLHRHTLFQTLAGSLLGISILSFCLFAIK
jgi:membrane-associated phospholipid phosphatase